jgi:hypothetical protein
MKLQYLFPNKCKKIGWFILLPTSILGLAVLIFDYNPEFLNFNIPAFFINELFGKNQFYGMVTNNILNEILGVLVIISSIMVAFSKEKVEDEYILKIRLESLVWAVYVNYGILLVSFLFIFDLSFLWVMIFNMFTVLIFFIVRFNWQISKLKNLATYEE